MENIVKWNRNLEPLLTQNTPVQLNDLQNLNNEKPTTWVQKIEREAEETYARSSLLPERRTVPLTCWMAREHDSVSLI